MCVGAIRLPGETGHISSEELTCHSVRQHVPTQTHTHCLNIELKPGSLCAGPAPFSTCYPSPCALTFFAHAGLRGKSPPANYGLASGVCNKGCYSCRHDGEKPVLAASMALLRGVSKMKRLDFEARLLPKTLELSTQCNAMQSATLLFLITFSVCHQVYAERRR